MIGTPSSDDINSIKDVEPQLYLKRLKLKPKKDLHLLFPKASAKAVDLLERMLTFDPKKRITVSEALAHPFIKSIRQPKSGMNYSKMKEAMVTLNFNDNAKMTHDELRKLFREEGSYWSRR